MSKPESNSELIAGLAEEFVARYRNGERPPISEYTARRPELAREIREFFEAVALIENLAPSDSRTVTGPEQPGPDPGSERLDRLGDYRIIREVGRGGMGVVYEAEQLSLGRHVALKVLPAQLLIDDKQRLRFEREAKAAARLHHTNIVPVFGVGHEGGTHYYVMQFIQGKGLDQVLDDLRQLRLQRMLASGASEVGGPESYGAGSPGALEDVPAASLAKSLLDGRFHETQIDPALGDLAANALSEDAPQTVCRGGSPLTPPAGHTTEDQPSLGSQNPLDGRLRETHVDRALDDLPANARSDDTLQTVCRGGSPLTPPAGQTTEEQPSLGSRTASHATEPGSLPNDRGPTSESPAGGVTGLPPRHDRSSGFLLPTDSNSASGSKSRLPTYWESVARIGTQIASALQYAHGQGVLHRDIKPSNLLLDLRATVWITDFGLAKADDQENLTHTGDILGTLRYMPPEAFDGKTDQRSDLYALGLTLYELLAFRPAFDERDRRKLIQQVTEANPVRLERLDKAIPRDLATIVHKAIEREPAHRYQSGQELADDLQRFLNDEPIHARRISSIERFTRWRRRNRGLAEAVMTVAGLLIFVAIGASITGAYFRLLNHRLTQTVIDLKVATDQAGAAKLDAQRRADDNLRLAQAIDFARQAEIDAKTAEQQRALQLTNQQQINRRQLYALRINRAQEAWTEVLGRGRMREFLEVTRPEVGENDLRGWEWYYLRGLLNRETLALDAAGKMVQCVRFSPDGKRVAAAGQDKSVRVLDETTGHLIWLLEGHRGPLLSLAWSPDGTRLASAGRDTSVKIWNSESGVLEASLDTEHSIVAAVAFSNNGRWIAMGAGDPAPGSAVLSIWDASTLKLHSRLSTRCTSLAWSPNDDQIVTQSFDSADVFKVPELQPLRTVSNARNLIDGETGWSPSGALVATADRNDVVLADPATGRRLATLAGHRATPSAVVFSRDSQRLATGARDGTLRVWNCANGTQEDLVRVDEGPVWDVDWSPDGTRFVTAGTAGVRIWSAVQAATRDVQQYDLRCGGALDMCWSPDGRQIAVIGNRAECLILEAATGAVITRYPLQQSRYIPTVSWCSRHPWVICSACEGAWSLFDVESGNRLTLPQPLEVAGTGVAWSPRGDRLATGGRSSDVTIWNIEDWSQIARLQRTGPSARVTGIAWSPDSSRLVVADTLQSIVWDLDSRQSVHSVHGFVSAPSWSNRGDRLALPRTDRNAVDILDTSTWRRVGRLKHNSIPNRVCWNNDDSRLCTVSDDNTVRIWETDLYGELLRFNSASDRVAGAAWDPESRRLAWVDFAGILRIADANQGYKVESLGQRKVKLAEFERLDVGGAAANSLFNHSKVEWRIWKPSALTTLHGQPLELQENGSLLSNDEITPNDRYEVTGECPVGRIAAIRLETLPHQSLPGKGPGSYDGTFHISGIEVSTRSNGGDWVRVHTGGYSSDFWPSLSEAATLNDGPLGLNDDDPATGWGNRFRRGEANWLILPMESAVEMGPANELRVVLQFQHPQFSPGRLGCFRVSLASEVPDLFREEIRSALQRNEIDPNCAVALAWLAGGTPTRALQVLESANVERHSSTADLLIRSIAHSRLEQAAIAREHFNAACDQLASHSAAHIVHSLARRGFQEVLGLSYVDAFRAARDLERQAQEVK